MGLIIRLFFTFIILCALAVAGFATYIGYNYEKKGEHSQNVHILIERGDNIAASLYSNNLIQQPLIFKIITRISGDATQLKAGEYDIPAEASMKDIIAQLVEGQTIERRFTIREGLTSYETIELIKNVENLQGSPTRIPAEGALLPNTYDYQKNDQRDVIIGRMQNAMEELLIELCALPEGVSFDAMQDLPCANAPSPLKTAHDVLTLASIVEKETAVPDERERVAGVFLNRLRKNIALQTDPTVIYAITKGEHKNDGKGPLGRRLLKKDLAIDSPYNTYKYPGLPPGPIANPGEASLRAVLNPEQHDYIYFVADGSGGHAFARTLTEHNNNVAKWRKIRKNQ